MASVPVPRDQIADGSLPSVCVVCGADAPLRRFPGVAAPSLAWVLFSPIMGLVTFWAYILFAGSSSGGGGLPFCDRHHHYWPRRAWFIVGGFVALIGIFVAVAVFAPPPPPNARGRDDEPGFLLSLAGCWMVVYLLGFVVVHLSATRPIGGSRKTLMLSGASREFVAAIKGEGGRS